MVLHRPQRRVRHPRQPVITQLDFPPSPFSCCFETSHCRANQCDGPTRQLQSPPEVDIRPLTADQLDGALALSTLMGWNQRLEDWRTLVELAPSGCFAALRRRPRRRDGYRDRLPPLRLDCDDAGGAGVPRPWSRRPPARGGDGRTPTGAADSARRHAARPAAVRASWLRAGNVADPARQARRHDDGRGRDRGHASAACAIFRRSPASTRPSLAASARGCSNASTARDPSTRGAPAVRRFRYCLGRTGRLFNQIGPIAATTAADGDRARRGGAAQRARPRRGRRRLRRTRGIHGLAAVRQASKPSARSIACGGLARLRLDAGRARTVDGVRDSRAGVRVRRLNA